MARLSLREIDRQRVVGGDAANPGGGKHDDVGLDVGDVALGVRLAREIDLAAIDGQGLAVFRGETANDGGSHHAAMTGDEDALALQREKFLSRHVAVLGG